MIKKINKVPRRPSKGRRGGLLARSGVRRACAGPAGRKRLRRPAPPEGTAAQVGAHGRAGAGARGGAHGGPERGVRVPPAGAGPLQRRVFSSPRGDVIGGGGWEPGGGGGGGAGRPPQVHVHLMKRHLTVGQDAREAARAGRTAAPPEPIAGPASPWASRRGRGAQPAGPRPLRGERRPDGLAARGGRARRRYEFRRADRYVAHHLGGAGVAQENHLGPGGLPAGVSEGRGGPLQAAGAPAARDHRQSKWRPRSRPRGAQAPGGGRRACFPPRPGVRGDARARGRGARRSPRASFVRGPGNAARAGGAQAARGPGGGSSGRHCVRCGWTRGPGRVRGATAGRPRARGAAAPLRPEVEAPLAVTRAEDRAPAPRAASSQALFEQFLVVASRESFTSASSSDCCAFLKDAVINSRGPACDRSCCLPHEGIPHVSKPRGGQTPKVLALFEAGLRF